MTTWSGSGGIWMPVDSRRCLSVGSPGNHRARSRTHKRDWTARHDPDRVHSLGSGILSFLFLAAVVFFVFVKPMNKWKEFTGKMPADPAVPPPPITEQLLTEIRDLLTDAKN